MQLRLAGADGNPSRSRNLRVLVSFNIVQDKDSTVAGRCGTDGLRNAKLDLCTLVQAVADDTEFEARSRERSVRVVVCEACPMMGAIELLKSAIENVVRNAVYYTKEKTEVEIALRCEVVEDDRYAVINAPDGGLMVEMRLPIKLSPERS